MLKEFNPVHINKYYKAFIEACIWDFTYPPKADEKKRFYFFETLLMFDQIELESETIKLLQKLILSMYSTCGALKTDEATRLLQLIPKDCSFCHCQTRLRSIVMKTLENKKFTTSEEVMMFCIKEIKSIPFMQLRQAIFRCTIDQSSNSQELMDVWFYYSLTDNQEIMDYATTKLIWFFSRDFSTFVSEMNNFAKQQPLFISAIADVFVNTPEWPSKQFSLEEEEAVYPGILAFLKYNGREDAIDQIINSEYYKLRFCKFINYFE